LKALRFLVAEMSNGHASGEASTRRGVALFRKISGGEKVSTAE
jgi:hypothetical protein